MRGNGTTPHWPRRRIGADPAWCGRIGRTLQSLTQGVGGNLLPPLLSARWGLVHVNTNILGPPLWFEQLTLHPRTD